MQWIVPLQSSTLPSKSYSLALISLIREKQNLKLNLLIKFNLVEFNFSRGGVVMKKRLGKML